MEGGHRCWQHDFDPILISHHTVKGRCPLGEGELWLAVDQNFPVRGQANHSAFRSIEHALKQLLQLSLVRWVEPVDERRERLLYF